MKPGDTTTDGEVIIVCPRCQGIGRYNGRLCPVCNGTTMTTLSNYQTMELERAEFIRMVQRGED